MLVGSNRSEIGVNSPNATEPLSKCVAKKNSATGKDISTGTVTFLMHMAVLRYFSARYKNITNMSGSSVLGINHRR